MLEVAGVSKSYGSVRALDDVSARFLPGEIHAVLGENGAGKSTLMHVMSGFAVPDVGTVTLDGKAIPLGRPFECRRAGIGMIHQHFTLVPAFTVRENLLLSDAAGVQQALALSGELHWDVPLDARTGSLPVGAQQRVEILKSLAGDSKVAIFDEPTAVLSREEVEDLFRVLRRLRDSGQIVVLIAHKLREVLSVADRVTVLRRGRVVGETMVSETSAAQLAQWMVGELPAELMKQPTTATSAVVRLENVAARGDRGEQVLQGIDLEVRSGEILGIGGVDGNGQVELAEVLAGVRSCEGKLIRPKRVAYIPQDRQTDGLALPMSIEDNLLIGGFRRRDLRLGPVVKRKAARQWAAHLAKRFDLRAESVADPVGRLSGGNQQKVVVARALDQDPELLVAVNPARGLDVRATDTVHRHIISARDSGCAVVLISTDLDELAALADRTVFISRGRIVLAEGAEALVGGGA